MKVYTQQELDAKKAAARAKGASARTKTNSVTKAAAQRVQIATAPVVGYVTGA